MPLPRKIGIGRALLGSAARVYTPLVAGLAGLVNRSNAHQTGTARYQVVVLRSAAVVRLVYANYYKTGINPQEAPNTNSIDVKAALEYGGVTYPVFFGGARTVTIAGGVTVTSDPIAITLPAGALLYIRTYWDAGASGYMPTHAMQVIGAGFGGTDSYVYDTDSADATGGLANAVPAVLYAPSAMLGSSPAATVCVLGDSTELSADIAYTRQSTASGATGYNGSDGGGWPQRGLRTLNIGHFSLAFGSERALDFAGSNIASRLPLATTVCRPTHWLIIYGRNDLVGGVLATDIQTRLLAIANLAVSYGIRPIASTIPPKSADVSSAAWATSGTQTVEALNSVRTTVNDWLRAVPAPFVACVDAADQLETSRNSGVWNTGPVQSSGTATSAAATTLTRSPALWTANQFADGDRVVHITGGTGSGQIRPITGNSTTVLTVASAWSVTPDATSTFEIYPRYTADGVHPGFYGHYLIGLALATQFAGGLP